jgi:hypothetical protein
VNEPGTKLTTYCSERDRAGAGALLADALFDVYERDRIQTSVLLPGVDSFGRRHQLQSDALLTLSEDSRRRRRRVGDGRAPKALVVADSRGRDDRARAALQA